MSNPKVSSHLYAQIMRAIRRIMHALDVHSRRLMEDYGLTGPQLAVLNEVAHLGKVKAADLAGLLQVSDPTMAGIIERLERAGLVERQRNAGDRRSLLISATKSGEALLADAPPLLQENFRCELDLLKEWEQSLILATLQRVADMMEQDRGSQPEKSPSFVDRSARRAPGVVSSRLRRKRRRVAES